MCCQTEKEKQIQQCTAPKVRCHFICHLKLLSTQNAVCAQPHLINTDSSSFGADTADICNTAPAIMKCHIPARRKRFFYLSLCHLFPFSCKCITKEWYSASFLGNCAICGRNLLLLLLLLLTLNLTVMCYFIFNPDSEIEQIKDNNNGLVFVT